MNDHPRGAATEDQAPEPADTEVTEEQIAWARKRGRELGMEDIRKELAPAIARAIAARRGFRNPQLAARVIDAASIRWANQDAAKVDEREIRARLERLASSDAYLLRPTSQPPATPRRQRP